MTPTRVALIAGGSALVAAWLTAATTTRQVEVLGETLSAPAESRVQNPAALGLVAEVKRLQMRHRVAPVPRSGERNPFEIHILDGPVGLSPSVPESLPTLTVSLAGVAENSTPDGLVRTAILSVLGEVVLAAPEAVIAGRFVVEWIGPSEVGLRDLETGEIRTLELP